MWSRDEWDKATITQINFGTVQKGNMGETSERDGVKRIWAFPERVEDTNLDWSELHWPEPNGFAIASPFFQRHNLSLKIEALQQTLVT